MSNPPSDPNAPPRSRAMNPLLKRMIRDITVGVTVGLITAFFTWLISHVPKGNQFVKLNSFEEVLNKATSVVKAADSSNAELWMAVDVPSYGSSSVENAFIGYKAALAQVQANQVASQHILWFSRPFEKAYAEKVEQMSPPKVEKALGDSDAVRNLLPQAGTADFPILAFHNFWISRDSHGTHHVVICWFAIQPGGQSKMQGLYSTSNDLADLMKHVWGSWKDESDKGYMSKFMNLPIEQIAKP